MKYFNWQDYYRQSFERKTPEKPTTVSEIVTETEITPEQFRAHAWAELQKICTDKELTNLLLLAQEYDSGRYRE